MSGNPENDDEDQFRPVWETEDEDVPPGAGPRVRKHALEPDYDYLLLVSSPRQRSERCGAAGSKAGNGI